MCSCQIPGKKQSIHKGSLQNCKVSWWTTLAGMEEVESEQCACQACEAKYEGVHEVEDNGEVFGLT